MPIPNCLDPDGTGTPCPYPKLKADLMRENMEAWEIWGKFAESLIVVQVHMAGAMFTLNSEFLTTVMEWTGVTDKVATFRKVRAIFNEWKAIQDAATQSKTQKSMARTRALRRGG